MMKAKGKKKAKPRNKPARFGLSVEPWIDEKKVNKGFGRCLPYNTYPNFDGPSFVGDSFPLITTNKHYLKHNVFAILSSMLQV